jgi:hypothetical protein
MIVYRHGVSCLPGKREGRSLNPIVRGRGGDMDLIDIVYTDMISRRRVTD